MLKSQRNESIELQNQYSVSETYDLLSPTSPIVHNGNNYLLKRPADTSNLKQVCFRAFNPIVKRNIQELTGQSIIIKIFPMIFGSQSSYSGYNIYNVHPINGANRQMLRVSEDVINVPAAGTIAEIIGNINESIASYCDNIKTTNGTFTFTNGTTFYELGDSIKNYYDAHLTFFDSTNEVNPTLRFTSLSDDDEAFYTNNGVFELTSGDNKVYLFFAVDVVFSPYSLFNVSTYRQYFNVYDFIRSQSPVNNYVCVNNDCISTNTNFSEQLAALQLNYNGYNIVLKSSLMKNLTGIVYVNKTEAQIVMKGSNEQGSVNYIDVSLTDINGNTLTNEYLTSIYDSILIDVDYVFDGLL